MPSQNMLPKGQRRRSVKAEYRAQRGVEPAGAPVIPRVELDVYAPGGAEQRLVAPAEARGMRLDQYLAQALPEVSRSRVQMLIDAGQVLVNGAAAKPKHKVSAGEEIALLGAPQPTPLKAEAEAIPLEIVYEDESLAIVNKPAGMTVHAGAAKPRSDKESADEGEGEAATDPRSAGTLVNALLHHFRGQLSGVGGELRPGIVHRLDKETSGLLLVAKNDRTHRRLGKAFAARTVEKTYVALVHGALRAGDEVVTISLPIGRDLTRRTRMTTRRGLGAPGVRHAVSHVRVMERLGTVYGAFTLVEVQIETGRTHQIRVHLQALGHPVVGDTTYGAPGELRAEAVRVGMASGGRRAAAGPERPALRLKRNFLHAARLRLAHPQTGEAMDVAAPLPGELVELLEALRAAADGTEEGGRTPMRQTR